MKSDDGIGAVILILLGISLPFFYYSKTCEWRWKDTTYNAKWDITSGCKIKTPLIGWVPEKNIAIQSISTKQAKDYTPDEIRTLNPKEIKNLSDEELETFLNTLKKDKGNDPLGIR